MMTSTAEIRVTIIIRYTTSSLAAFSSGYMAFTEDTDQSFFALVVVSTELQL